MEPPTSWNWEPEPAENLTDRQARYESGRQKAIEYLGKIATTDLAYNDAQATKAYLESGVLTPSFYRAKNANPWAQGAGYDGNRAIFDIDGMVKVARDYNPQLANDPDYLNAYLASVIAHEANHAREFAQGVAPFRGRTLQQKRDMELNSYQLQQSLLRTTGYNTRDMNPVGVDDPAKLRDLLYDREAYANGHRR